VSIIGGESAVAFIVRRFRADIVAFLAIVHLLVLKKRVKRGKIGSLDVHRGGCRKLLLGRHDF